MGKKRRLRLRLTRTADNRQDHALLQRHRHGKSGKKQIVFGLLCAADGCPISVEVFAGNTADPATVAAQVDRIRKRFGLSRIALVGDRGMLTSARIREDVEPAGLDWVSALKSSDLKKLARPSGPNNTSALKPGELVPDAVAEITSPDFPGERLMVCLNPRLRDERRRKRGALLRATEATLDRIAASVRAGTLAGKAGSATGSARRPAGARSRSTSRSPSKTTP